jgi:hypothetical protein
MSFRVFGYEENNALAMNDFLTGVGQLKFRGTSLLLRSPQSVFSMLKEKEASEFKVPMSATESMGHRKRSRPDVLESDNLDRPCLFSFESMDESEALSFVNPSCENGATPDYDFATHVVKVKRSGHVVDVKSLWDFESTSDRYKVVRPF